MLFGLIEPDKKLRIYNFGETADKTVFRNKEHELQFLDDRIIIKKTTEVHTRIDVVFYSQITRIRMSLFDVLTLPGKAAVFTPSPKIDITTKDGRKIHLDFKNSIGKNSLKHFIEDKMSGVN